MINVEIVNNIWEVLIGTLGHHLELLFRTRCICNEYWHLSHKKLIVLEHTKDINLCNTIMCWWEYLGVWSCSNTGTNSIWCSNIYSPLPFIPILKGFIFNHKKQFLDCLSKYETVVLFTWNWEEIMKIFYKELNVLYQSYFTLSPINLFFWDSLLFTLKKANKSLLHLILWLLLSSWISGFRFILVTNV